jgi:hypothetical protein
MLAVFRAGVDGPGVGVLDAGMIKLSREAKIRQHIVRTNHHHIDTIHRRDIISGVESGLALKHQSQW